MTTAEIIAYYKRSIEYFKRSIEYDTREIEYLNKEIKRQRAESKRMVNYVWSFGVLKKYELEIYTADYKNTELKKAERDRAKAYRSRKRHETYIRKYEKELQKLEPQAQPAEEPQEVETEAQAQQQEAETMTEPKPTRGTIASTGERCEMRANGYWTGDRGRHITSYERTDKQEYNKDGKPVFRQYSMDRHRRFYLETEDEKHDY